ncbi:MAG: membrane dipeptidase [Clostridiales bacterium]|jgi:microsomal dipeptidase-like Zn-dependent dipeptidase|nr:membrane dipeptidase [Clostridiales bacterium]
MFDFHNDLLTSGLGAEEIQKILLRYRADGIRPVLAVWTTRGVKTFADVLCALAPAVAVGGFRYAIEDLGFLRENEAEQAAAYRFAYVTPTWNRDNALGGGAYGTSGLTAYGKEVLTRFAAAGTAIDTAHMNERTFWEVAALPDVRLVNSHTACAALHPHPRNLTDAQLRRIVDGGGAVGITPVGAFLCAGKATRADYRRHLAYFTDQFGAAPLRLGSDFYGTDDIPEGLGTYEEISALF